MKLVSFVSFLFHQVGSIGYESLKVQNHTECECIYRDRQIATHSRHAGTSRVSHALPRTTSRRPARPSRCRCPSHFDAELDEGHCGCVCRDGKAECRRRYEGKEGFTLSDQRFVFDFIQSPTLLNFVYRCIMHKVCEQPHCLYGAYITNNGRCPDKNDPFRMEFKHRPK